MPVIKSRPTSPGRRHHIKVDVSHLHKGAPYKPLLSPKPKHSGRNNLGRITVRHQGGGAKQKYRIIDFKRDKDNVVGIVERLEYDPNRSSHIALIKYSDGERRYIIAPESINVGEEIISGLTNIEIKTGNVTILRQMPLGTVIHCIELKPKKGAQMVRSAGASSQLIAKEGDYASIRLRSGEVRRVHLECRATIGAVGNFEHSLRSLGKAGASRHRGIRPTVRGVAMNPVDHPHGGGEGKTSGGRHPVTPWGVKTKGFKTRKRNNPSDIFIVRSRRSKK
ncbi:MAG: 50S ribosomal protein L2 [Candidatus Portiera sp.]|nr:50S ribosomal protein L2 [Portiera sp.]